MMMLYSLNGLVWQVIGIVAPPPLILGSGTMKMLKGNYFGKNTGNGEHNSGTTRGPSFVKEQREKNRQFQIYSWYQGAARNMISLVVCFPVFWYHWKVARRLE